MEIATSPLSFCRTGSTTAFKVVGRATFVLAPAARRFIEECMSQGVSEVQLDLSECSHMDSTFLGTLLSLKRSADRRRPPCRVTCRSLSTPCQHVLRQAGLDPLFPSAGECARPEIWTPVPGHSGKAGDLEHEMVAAHQELARLPGAAGDQFRPIAARLEAEYARDKAPAPD